MVNYIINNHFGRKNQSWDSKFTILKFSICRHCISLVNEASDWADLVENSIFTKIWSDFDPLNFVRMFPGFFVTKVPTMNIPKLIRQWFSATLLGNLTSDVAIFVKIVKNQWFSLVLGGGSGRSHLPEGVDFGEFLWRMRFVTFYYDI